MSRSAAALRIRYVSFHVADLCVGPIARLNACRVAGPLMVVGAQALFLWMFFAADPLEQLAASGAVGVDPAVRDCAFAFAAAWRHGMASNSPLYMPGFFVVAVTAWLFARLGRPGEVIGFGLGLAAAAGLALTAASIGADAVIHGYQEQSGIRISDAAPAPGGRAILSGIYTLLTWTVFIVGCRAALARRSLRPLLPVPVLTVLLIFVRPWTVDEFTTIWWRQAGNGNPVAIVSAVLIPLLAWFLAARVPAPAATASRASGARL